MYFPTEIVPVLGDMLVFSGVSHRKGNLENHRLKSAILGEEMLVPRRVDLC